MKRGGPDRRQVELVLGVIRTLVHILEIIQSKKVTKYSAKPVKTERRTQPTFKERWVGTMRHHKVGGKS